MDEVTAAVHASLQAAAPDLTLLFVTRHHAEGFPQVAHEIMARTGTRILLGCTGEAVVCGGEEIERAPALSLWSAVLPATRLEPFHLEFSHTPDGFLCTGLPEAAESASQPARAILVLGEPFSSVPDSFLTQLSDAFPGVPIVGGMASGGLQPGENRLFLGGEALRHGAAGVILHGGPFVRTVVSQGCRPIGTPFVVTRAERNIVVELGGLPALQQFANLLPRLPPRDQQLARRGLHLGLAMNEYQAQFGRGDFLVANVIGADDDSGAIAIGNYVRVGQTVQFHVRDAESAHEDLVELLRQARSRAATAPRAGLLFSCNGRGTRLFDRPNHDAGTIQRELGPIPLAGFFAQGELGPVGGRNFIHGFTASVCLFE